MFGWFRERKLDDVLNPTQIIRVHGVRFRIRKLNPMDYLGGSKSVRQLFETMKAGGISEVEIHQTQQRDIEAHYVDTFLSAVVEPKLRRAERGPADEAGTPAANLLTDWDFANQLYRAIIEFSYGKKKIAQLSSKAGFSK